MTNFLPSLWIPLCFTIGLSKHPTKLPAAPSLSSSTYMENGYLQSQLTPLKNTQTKTSESALLVQRCLINQLSLSSTTPTSSVQCKSLLQQMGRCGILLGRIWLVGLLLSKSRYRMHAHFQTCCPSNIRHLTREFERCSIQLLLLQEDGNSRYHLI
jgi:hypothetical protein